ncbi:hypothetical protein [Pedobacter sp. WC2423]|uniref:hypothetical protein n=1 Tax=Pedobacter sp. WC2423 TaxID=3234142 RepID=UPI003467971A
MQEKSNRQRDKQQTGNCYLCGKLAILSFEHIPPQCAFNNKPILVQGHEQLIEKNSYLYGKKKRSQRGFGKQSLCVTCNNNSGNWYAKDFCKFAEQGWKILKANKVPEYVLGSYEIKPLNVLKQILMMFVATDSTGVIGNISGVKDYLLNKESTRFPDKINIHIYSNASPTKRMIGYCVVGDMGTNEIYKWAEINYHPFGYFFTYDSPPPNEFMVDITDFTKVPFDKEYKVELTTAYLKVENVIIGNYGNI